MLLDQFGRPFPAPAPRQIGFVPAAEVTPPKQLEGGYLADAVAWKTIQPEEDDE
jgi:hypothetical protein